MSSSLGGYSGFKGSGARGGMAGDVIPSGYRAGQMQQFTPQQMQLFKQRLGDVGPDSYTSRLSGGDESLFNEMEAPGMRQFSELLGGLSSRFSAGGGQGSLGNRKSSGFQNATTSAASNFAQELQANRQGLQRQAIQDIMGMSQNLLGLRPQDRFLMEKRQKKSQGGWGGAASGAASGALAGSSLGPWGALAGGVIGGASGYFS